MNRINDVFKHQKSVFITYLVCGDPDINSTLKMMHSMVENGVDLIELGIPFTDAMKSLLNSKLQAWKYAPMKSLSLQVIICI